MCGIAGFVTIGQTPDRSLIEKQLSLLEHRGPDASGYFMGKTAVIGQTRLSVIDLDTGDPPISNGDGSIGVALNGEIYNYRDLRDRLHRSGHTFETSGDTEVLAHLAEDLDPAQIATSLEGMFAFAIWNEQTSQLTLGRDRLGKKPLYYWQGPGVFVFASEIKSLLVHPAVPRELDLDRLGAYLTFGYVPTPHTFYAGIKSLRPGHVLSVGPDGVTVTEPYWHAPVASPVPERPRRERTEVFRASLTRAVQDRLVADVPVGAFLSGGLDSSAIVAIASELLSQPLQTFTIGFEDSEGFDERSFAREVAQHFRTQHTEFVVEPKAVELVETLVWHHDQPFGDSSAIPMYLLSELTSKEVKVALSGDGGDELLAGYERFRAAMAAAGPLGGAAGGAGALLQRLPSHLIGGKVGKLQRFSSQAALGLPDALRAWISYIDEASVKRLLPGYSDWGLEDYRQIWASLAPASTLKRVLALNLRTYLLDDLLVKLDRMSMAHGLEVRSPFLDHRLLQDVARLPPSDLMRGSSSKRILRWAMEGVLPKRILSRGKRGFGVPLDRWFRDDLRTYMRSALGPSARIRTHLRGGEIDRLLTEHDAGSRNHGHALWTLLVLEVFFQREGW